MYTYIIIMLTLIGGWTVLTLESEKWPHLAVEFLNSFVHLPKGEEVSESLVLHTSTHHKCSGCSYSITSCKEGEKREKKRERHT